jgi:hypothetical protein
VKPLSQWGHTFKRFEALLVESKEIDGSVVLVVVYFFTNRWPNGAMTRSSFVSNRHPFWHILAPCFIAFRTSTPRVSLPSQNVVLDSWSWLLDAVAAGPTRPVPRRHMLKPHSTPNCHPFFPIH